MIIEYVDRALNTLKAAGIEDAGRGLYGFRHGFCVALANNFFGEHWSRPETQEMMRHSNPKTTSVYYHVLTPVLAEKAANSKPLSTVFDFERTGASEPSPIRKGAIRHGSPLLEVR